MAKVRLVVGQYVRFTFNIRQTGRWATPEGRFTSLRESTGEEIAGRMVQAALDQLDHMRRRSGGHGRLRRAIAAPENVKVTAKTIQIFKVRWLDQQVRQDGSDSWNDKPRGGPYWRAVDLGSDAAIGRYVPGYMRSTGGGHSWYYTGDPPLKTGGFARARRDMRKMREYGKWGKPWQVIKEGIEPHHFVNAAAEAFTHLDASEIADDIISQYKLKYRG